jgi:hypothetical protein
LRRVQHRLPHRQRRHQHVILRHVRLRTQQMDVLVKLTHSRLAKKKN